MRSRSLPLLAEQGIRVLACGLSVAADGEPQADAYLIRAFASAAERTRQEEAFYSSQVWIAGPRDDVVSRIVDFHTVVLEASPEAARLRKLGRAAGARAWIGGEPRLASPREVSLRHEPRRRHGRGRPLLCPCPSTMGKAWPELRPLRPTASYTSRRDVTAVGRCSPELGSLGRFARVDDARKQFGEQFDVSGWQGVVEPLFDGLGQLTGGVECFATDVGEVELEDIGVPGVR